MIAQCVYTSVMFAYPNSWISFDEDFKTEVCNYITLWQEGTKPMPNSWIKWELRLLEPVNLPKCKMDEGDQFGVKSAGSFDFDTLLRNARRKALWRSPSPVKNSGLESSFERKLSIGEVREALSSFPNGGGEGGEGGGKDAAAGQCDEEKEKERLGVAMKQLNTLEQSKAKLLTLQQTSPSNQGGGGSTMGEISPAPECSNNRKEEVSTSGGEGGGDGRSPKHHRAVCIKEDENIVRTEKRTEASAGGAGSTTTSTRCARPKPVATATTPLASTTNRKSRGVMSWKHDKSRTCRSSTMMWGGSGGGTRNFEKRPSSSARAQSATTTTTATATATTTSTIVTSRRKSSDAAGGGGGCGSSVATYSGRGSATASRRGSMDSSHAPGVPLVAIPHGGTSKYDGKLKKMALTFKKQQQESATLKGPDFEHVVFNLFGHSPLVKHYIDNMNLSHVIEKEIVVGRTEIVEEPPKDAICYKDVLLQSKMVTDSNREEFLRCVRLLLSVC